MDSKKTATKPYAYPPPATPDLIKKPLPKKRLFVLCVK